MPTPFPPYRTIKELGIDTARKFIVLPEEDAFNPGDILVLENDDNTRQPEFKRISDGETNFIALDRLAYADEQEEKKEPYVPRVGDRVSLEGEVTKVYPGARARIVFKGANNGIVMHELEVKNATLLSRAPRTLTKYEAEKLLKEKLGEDVTIE